MTTIVVRDGCIASDSISTIQTEAGGSRMFKCVKLYPCMVHNKETNQLEPTILATAGESMSSLLFVEWYKTRADHIPQKLIDGGADFTVLALTPEGLFEYDAWCHPDKIELPFYAIGSGAKAALGALHMGATAEEAVRIACEVDPYSRPPIKKMTLADVKSE